MERKVKMSCMSVQRRFTGMLMAGLLGMVAVSMVMQLTEQKRVMAAQSAKPATATHGRAQSAKLQADESSDGDRVFQQQCSRCHSAPEGFSPSISGTIVRHMRVRASLSAEEEKALLRFLNP
jgi:cytochrome c5